MLVTIYSDLVDKEFFVETEMGKARPHVHPLFYLKELEVINATAKCLEKEERIEYFNSILEAKIAFKGAFLLDEDGKPIVPKAHRITKRRTRRPAPGGGALANLQKKIAKDNEKKG